MALVVKDRVKQFSTTSGTGTLTLGATPSGFQAFSVVGDGNTTYYAIVDPNTGDWEVGLGTYTLAGTTLSRDTVLESSNSGSLVNFSSDTKDVFVTYPAEKAVMLDDVQTLTNKTINGSSNTITNVSLSSGVTGTLPVANGGTGITSAGTAGNVLTSNGTNWTSSAPAGFPSGTKMMFVQTSAPTGWTKDTTHNNKALRVVSGTASSGGSVAFTTAFASQGVSGTIANTTAGGSVSVSGSVGNSTLSVGQLAAHSHTTFFFVDGDDGGGGRIGLTDFNFDGYSTTTTSANTGSNESHGHSFSGSGSFSGTAHNHSFTGTAINLAVQYVDVIIATKD